MKTLKNFEEHVIKNLSDLKNNWSTEYHVNMSVGKKPYIKKGEIFIEVEENKTIPKNVIYLDPEKVEKYNLLATEIIRLKEEQNNIIK